MAGKRKKDMPFSFLASLRSCSLLLHLVLVLGVFLTGAAIAAPPCEPITHTEFARIPMRIMVVSEIESTGLQAVISDLNGKQDVYDLAISPKSDSPVHLTIGEDYDGVLVFDRVMMLGNSPKYNRYLRTYRNSELSDHAMVVDFELDKEGRISFPFIQVAAENSERQRLLMEIGLMALSNLRLMQDKAFMEYYFKVDAIITDDGPIGSPSDLEEIAQRREEIIIGCFLTGK